MRVQLRYIFGDLNLIKYQLFNAWILHPQFAFDASPKGT